MKDLNHIKVLFIDLDGTLYSNNCGLENCVFERMKNYFEHKLGYRENKTIALMEAYYQKYGSTLRGIQMNHDIDAQEYLAWIHDVEYERFLAPDPQLYRILKDIPLPKWIFTNSDRNHTKRVLNILGLQDLFEGIIDVWALDYLPKPDPRVYDRVLEIAGGWGAREAMFFDDMRRNLRPAWYKGFTTVLVGSAKKQPFATLSLSRLHEIEKYFPSPLPDGLALKGLPLGANICR